eukprot:1338172-Prymnesium_polylepis.2
MATARRSSKLAKRARARGGVGLCRCVRCVGCALLVAMVYSSQFRSSSGIKQSTGTWPPLTFYELLHRRFVHLLSNTTHKIGSERRSALHLLVRPNGGAA